MNIVKETVETVEGKTVPLEEDWGVQAQREAEDHLTRVWAYFHEAEENGESEEDPSIGPFDGCQTCEVREMLYAVLPIIQAGLARDEGRPSNPLTVNLVQCPQETLSV